MNFDEYLKKALEDDPELKKEYDILQPEYEIINAIIQARTEQGMTQSELAKKCGTRQSNISRLESGKANPTLSLLKKIADALNCNLAVEFKKREVATESVIETEGSTYVSIELLYTSSSTKGRTSISEAYLDSVVAY